MKFPALKSQEVIGNAPPILIVDKIGIIGEELAKEFSQDYLVVLVSPKQVTHKNGKIIHILFKRRIPQAPDNRYSKIFVIDDGQTITRKSAFSFIEKARESGAQFYFIGSIRNIDIKHADEVASSYSKSQVLIFGDLFDRNILFDRNASISKFLLQARRTRRILVGGDGLDLSYPVSFADTIKLIIKATYLDISQKTILLFSPHPITDISLANTFKKINPDVNVDFIKEKRKRNIYIPQNSQHALSKYNLEEKIRELEIEEKENREVRVAEKIPRERNFLKPILSFVLLILFVILLPFLTTYSYLVLGEREMNKARSSVEAGNIDKAKKQVKNSKTLFEIAIKTSQPLILEGKYLGMKSYAQGIRKKAETGQSVAVAAIALFDGGELLRNIYNGESRDSGSDFLKASNYFKNSLVLIQKLKAEKNLPKDFENEYDNIAPFIDLFSNSSEILPDVLGFDSAKKYLVLFQDSAELRPGGGVVESFAILEVKNARIINFDAFDASPIDENLKTQIDPAFFLRRYLSIENLTLRDSSSDPDFINSAISASNIYSLAMDEKVDGVIAIDSLFIKSLLKVIGPVAVKGQSIKISAENIEKISLNDNNFDTEILNSIMDEFENEENSSYLLLVKELGISIKEKHLLFAFPKLSTQNIFTANGWSSSLWDNREKENNRINDYLGISEANLGKNKINKFVSRSIAKKIIVSEKGKVSSELTISYKNNSKKEGGVYKNYIQLILPEAAKITSVSINGETAEIEKAITDPSVYRARGFKPPSGFEIEERNQMDKNIYGLLIQVSSAEIKTIVIIYDLPYSLPSTQKSAKYSLKIYKQPGIDSYPFDLTFNLPENHKVLEIKKNISKEIKSDEDFRLTIAQE